MEIKKIYFDMDGVLADFDGGVEELCGLPRPHQGHDSAEANKKMWDAIRDAGHFYRRLKPMPGAVEMFEAVYNAYGDRCEILTGVPKPKRNIPEAGQDKIEWAREFLNDKVVVNTVLREEKINYCFGPEYLLIDDYTKNGLEWQKKGGTVINHSSSEDTVEQLKELHIL